MNLGNFVYDTADLNTMRGGGLVLLNASERVGALLTGDAPSLGLTKVEAIVSGASIGLFAIEGNAGADARAVDAVRRFLKTDTCLSLATVVVDAVPESSDFVGSRRAAAAANRWQQLQTPSLGPPADPATQSCFIDGLRPASERGYEGGAKRELSKTTAVRRRYGREQKQRFYHREIQGAGGAAAETTGLLDGYTFANSFEQIARRSDGHPLSNKMAVFYADGNRLGSAIEELGQSAPALRNASGELRRLQRTLLADLIAERLYPGEHWEAEPESDEDQVDEATDALVEDGRKVFRFETLLWGGDEIIWVMPAWKGWEVARFFFEHTALWNLPGMNRPVTHSAGLVFCQYHAPIQRILTLAHDLADFAKGSDPLSDQLVTHVLESFDHITGQVSDEFQRLSPPGAQVESWILRGSADLPLHHRIDRLRATLETLESPDFPRGRLYEVSGSASSPVRFRQTAAHLLKNAGASRGTMEGALTSWHYALGAGGADPAGDWATFAWLNHLWGYANPD